MRCRCRRWSPAAMLDAPVAHALLQLVGARSRRRDRCRARRDRRSADRGGPSRPPSSSSGVSLPSWFVSKQSCIASHAPPCAAARSSRLTTPSPSLSSRDRCSMSRRRVAIPPRRRQRRVAGPRARRRRLPGRGVARGRRLRGRVRLAGGEREECGERDDLHARETRTRRRRWRIFTVLKHRQQTHARGRRDRDPAVVRDRWWQRPHPVHVDRPRAISSTRAQSRAQPLAASSAHTALAQRSRQRLVRSGARVDRHVVGRVLGRLQVPAAAATATASISPPSQSTRACSASATVNGHGKEDHDVIEVGRHEGFFKKLTIVVAG